jgi:ATP-dependent DNA helicase RecQ
MAATDAPLFEALRAWRGDLARQQGVPAYVILHDKSLRELAARRPTTIAELLGVPGIGLAKADRYGEALLRLMA